MICTANECAQLGTILGVWAHPDDETYSMGGLMAAALANGQTVACITATRGEAGVQDTSRWPAESLGNIRTKELEAAFLLLGVSDHTWLDLPDGACALQDEKVAVHRISEVIARVRPSTICTFGPDGMTGHEDHKAVSRWASVAAAQAGYPITVLHAVITKQQYTYWLEADKQFNVFFNIDQPPLCKRETCAVHLELSDALYAKKLAALRAMPSQTEAMLAVFSAHLRPSIGVEAFARADI